MTLNARGEVITPSTRSCPACRECGGTGWAFTGYEDHLMTCPTCGGTGWGPTPAPTRRLDPHAAVFAANLAVWTFFATALSTGHLGAGLAAAFIAATVGLCAAILA